MWVQFVFGSLLAPRGFSPGTLVFPSPQKPTFPNSSSIRNGGRYPDSLPLMGLVCRTYRKMALLK